MRTQRDFRHKKQSDVLEERERERGETVIVSYVEGGGGDPSRTMRAICVTR